MHPACYWLFRREKYHCKDCMDDQHKTARQPRPCCCTCQAFTNTDNAPWVPCAGAGQAISLHLEDHSRLNFKLSLLARAGLPLADPNACPMQMLGEQIDVLRKSAGGRAQLLHAVSSKMSTFEAAEVERLQHAFVKLGGGDARKARVTDDRLT